jgi:hypothetical protein
MPASVRDRLRRHRRDDHGPPHVRPGPRALEAAGGADVRIGGGPAVIQQYLAAGLVDELHAVFVRE